MTTIEIPNINFTKDIPSSFDEMNQTDFIRFVKLYLDFQEGRIDFTQLKTEMVFQFLQVKSKWRIELLTEDVREQIYENIYIISEKLDFFFSTSTNDGNIHLNVNFPWTRWHVKQYDGYYGPADVMSDISFLEYKNAHVAAQQYLKSNDTFDLEWFCAILYRKPRVSFPKLGIGLFKPKYDEFDTNKIAAACAKWPFAVKYAILLDFLAIENYISTGRFMVDGVEISFSVLFSKSENDFSSAHAGLTSILYNLAATGVFGNAELTSKQNLYDVFYRLYQTQTEYNDLQKKLENDQYYTT